MLFCLGYKKVIAVLRGGWFVILVILVGRVLLYWEGWEGESTLASWRPLVQLRLVDVAVAIAVVV